MPSGLPSRYSISAAEVLTDFVSQMRLVPRRGLTIVRLFDQGMDEHAHKSARLERQFAGFQRL